MRRLEPGTPVILGNMLLVPVLGDDVEMKVITLDEGKDKGVTITDTGEISRAIIENPTDELVFVMDGEELLGAMQDRIAVYSEVIPNRSSQELEVVCIEKGRWEGDKSFTTGFTAFPRLRMSLSFEREKGNLQQTVWELIDRKLTTLRVSSATRSMHHTFVEKERELELYCDWEPEADTVGVMAFF